KLNTLAAGTPALVRKVSGDKITPIAGNVTISTALADGSSADIVKMYGSYEQGKTITDADAYYIKNDKFWQCNGSFFCDAFRAYFKSSGSSSPYYEISIDDDISGIHRVEGERERESVYDLQGRKVNGKSRLPKGINIVRLANGKTQKVVTR
ncbi:MAG: hypothetical protein J6X27_05265, partial [Bacteroidaceae bacterium]|nr:hypothetical protein [Bacteroidaceae bacterium]